MERNGAPIIDRRISSDIGESAAISRRVSVGRIVDPNRRRTSSVAIVAVIFGSFLLVVLSYSPPMVAYDEHGPIAVVGDVELASVEGITGQGTESDPYVIYNIQISDDDADAGISIIDTTKFLVISNVNVLPGTGSYISGIYLEDVSNVTVEESLLQDTDYGVYVYASENVTLRSNTIEGADYSIVMDTCDCCYLTDNELTNGWTGIQLSTVAICEIYGNTLDSFLYEGIYSVYVSDSLFSSNSISNCSSSAIWMDSSSWDCVITNNTLMDNDASFSIYPAGGVWLDDCSGMLVYHNSFYRNSPVHAYDYKVTGNLWNLSEPDGGNYWDDYSGADEDPPDGFGDDPYPIGGGAQDALPLMYPPGSEVPIPEFTALIVPVLVILAMFIIIRRR